MAKKAKPKAKKPSGTAVTASGPELAPEAEIVEAKPIDPPVEQPKKAEFQQLRCSDQTPEGFSGGRFPRNTYVRVIAARPFVRR